MRQKLKAGEKVWLIKCLPHQHEGPNPNSNAEITSRVHACSSRYGEVETEFLYLDGLLVLSNQVQWQTLS